MEPTSSIFQSTTSKEVLYETLVHLGDGRYRGLVQGTRDRETICLFVSRKSDIILGLPVSVISARSVREEIRKSNQLFEAFAETFSTKMLHHLGSAA